MVPERYATKTIGGDIDAPGDTTGTSIQYPTGPVDEDEAAVDEINLGAPAGVAGTAGAGLHRQLWLWVRGSGVTGTGTLTLDATVETDTTAAFSSAVTRFTAPQISMTQAASEAFFYNWPLPYLPEQYARIGLDPGGTNPVWTGVLCGISDNGDSKWIT